MRKVKRGNSKLLKVVDNTETDVQLNKKQEEDRNYEAFNEKCKELIRGEVRSLFDNSKLDSEIGRAHV